jgi:hypothetical protein
MVLVAELDRLRWLKQDQRGQDPVTNLGEIHESGTGSIELDNIQIRDG